MVYMDMSLFSFWPEQDVYDVVDTRGTVMMSRYRVFYLDTPVHGPMSFLSESAFIFITCMYFTKKYAQ